MTGKNWFVDNQGKREIWSAITEYENPDQPYRLYRFLTDLEDVLNQEATDYGRLQKIYPLVHRLLNDSPWFQVIPLVPDPETGWAVEMLYDEPDFPLTIQLVAWQPQAVSPIHNHGCWGLVALLQGQEKNTFWQRDPDTDQLILRGEEILEMGDLICLMPETIHRVEALGSQPTISFNVYGETDYDQRFQFDLTTGIATNF